MPCEGECARAVPSERLNIVSVGSKRVEAPDWHAAAVAVHVCFVINTCQCATDSDDELQLHCRRTLFTAAGDVGALVVGAAGDAGGQQHGVGVGRASVRYGEVSGFAEIGYGVNVA